MWSISILIVIICINNVFSYSSKINRSQRKYHNEALCSHNNNNGHDLRKKISRLFIGSSFLIGNVLPTLPAHAIDPSSLSKYTEKKVTPGAGKNILHTSPIISITNVRRSNQQAIIRSH
jgi:hypothetical protein